MKSRLLQFRELASHLVLRRVLRPRSPLRLERIGGDYGGWSVPVRVDEDWVCYTIGVVEEAALDAELAERGCDEVAVDPTPRAIEYISPLLEQHSTLRLLPSALSATNEMLTFYPPQNTAQVFYSAVNRQHTHADEALEVPGKTLSTIAAEAGHSRVDLLKLDNEGSEYHALPALDLAGLGVRVRCVEFHNDHGLRRMVGAIRAVEGRGYRVASVHRTDVTFVRDSLVPE